MPFILPATRERSVSTIAFLLSLTITSYHKEIHQQKNRTMKKLFSIMLLVCAVTLGAQAQLLYKISGNGLKVPSYIIGTYHFADVKFTDSIPGLKKALDETQQVYGELRITDMMNPDSLMKIQTAMLMPEGKKFTDLLTAEQTDRLNTFMKGLMGVDMTNPIDRKSVV